MTDADAARVGLVLVSHSAKVAEGLVELAGQMAPDVTIRAAGGGPDGGLGTDYALITAALDAADAGAGVVLLYDLGSAQLTAELAVEAAPDPDRALLVDAPLVEGAVAAAVAAQLGSGLAAVAAAARSAAAPAEVADPVADPAEETAEVELTNDIGLHARPAAQLARVTAGLDARITVAKGDSTADGRSVLALLGLAARRGDRLTITATGPDAAPALAAITQLIRADFAG